MTKRRHFLLSRSQWLGVLVLLLLLAAICACLYWWPKPLPEKPQQKLSTSSMVRHTPYNSYNRPYTPILDPRPFDPNTADSVTLTAVGLRGWQARNIIRYREAGGTFKSKESLRKIYGMTDSIYRQIEPWITIDSTKWTNTAQANPEDTIRRDTIRFVSHKKDTVIELNSADTTTLQFLRGIGPYYAKRIIDYRTSLGGYFAPQQVLEIDGLHFSEPDSLLRHLAANADSIQTIPVNQASVRRLMQHPYLSFTQASEIYDLRRRKVRLRCLEDLQTLPSLSENDLRRLKPYLKFD